MSVNKINKKGRFGKYGGQYMPETLMNAVNQLEEAVAGQHTTKEDYARATKEFAKNFYGLLADVNKAVPQNKLN